MPINYAKLAEKRVGVLARDKHLPKDNGAVADGAVVEGVKVKVSIGMEAVALEDTLHCGRLLARLRGDVGVDGELRALNELVLERQFAQDGVISGPFLLEGSAEITEAVFSLERGVDTTGIVDRGTGKREFHIVGGLGLDIQLDQAKICDGRQNFEVELIR